MEVRALSVLNILLYFIKQFNLYYVYDRSKCVLDLCNFIRSLFSRFLYLLMSSNGLFKAVDDDTYLYI